MNTRRHFIRKSAAAAASALGVSALERRAVAANGENISFGLCTYMWGSEWDVPAIISNLTDLKIRGVELRVEHAHKVEPALSPAQRAKVRAQFEEGGIEVVGIGTNAQFDSPDAAKLAANMDLAKQYIKLGHDVGGSGVKVKPNNFHDKKEGIPREKTLEQIGKSLAELGDFALGFGQEIRLEVHGDVTGLADIRRIMEIAKADNVRVCWNSNQADLEGEGLEKNFALVKDYLGHTTHIHELGGGGKSSHGGPYPFDKLAKLLVDADYDGWVLMEAASKVEDRFTALGEQKDLWEKLVGTARRS
jgi:sugar phosphate isomerase/epimerase